MSHLKLIKKLKEYNGKIDWVIFILIVLVSMGGWIDLFGFFLFRFQQSIMIFLYKTNK
jgi:hypothetical protein